MKISSNSINFASIFYFYFFTFIFLHFTQIFPIAIFCRSTFFRSTMPLISIFLGFTEIEVRQAEENHKAFLADMGSVGTTLCAHSDHGGCTRIVLVRSHVDETNFIEVRAFL